MRQLAIARYRMWTTVRAASPVFAIPLLFATLLALPGALLEASFMERPDDLMGLCATTSMISWLLHTALMFGIAQQFGTPKIDPDASVHPADLMDSAPVRPTERFGGEFSGILLATAFIHACCLPMLVVAAALSPLPMTVFAWLELLVVAFAILGSAAAAWRRIVMVGVRRSTAGVRTIALFFLLVVMVVTATTDAAAFRDSLVAFVLAPSMRAWSRVAATIQLPVAMAVLLAIIYAGYIAFFAVSSSRARVEFQEAS